MFEHKHIIVLLDPAEESAAAVEKAATLAQLSDSKLTLFSSGYDGALNSIHPHSENARDSYLSRLLDGLETLADTARSKNIQVSTEAVWDKHAGTAMLNYLSGNPADLVVKATHHQNVIQRTFFSQTDWELIRHCPVPLLLTKATAWHDNITLTAAVDPVRTNDKPDFLDDHIIQCGTEMRSLLNAKLQLLHVYDPTPLMIYLDQPAINSTDIGEEIRVQHQEALVELAQSKGIDKADARLEMGSPVQVIPDYLYEYDIDIVIMGAVSRSGLERWLLGHTAEKVLDRITVDILIAK
ncbi:universal stress protein [Reinekea blandensis]|uniref:Universal stress protein UspA and related nucleotide-binding protein n=1 Tax=Reinekea blandensis MED297 TaxID=314283 RepID=A4BFS9_9GAMM|nr:universal stress protein [Reinekea blandensis]EAR08947.1 Universal stress protein UspA and related nucleotide-binding protein [Reinekea sp. MED297] [Reinekea blandensis MED297]